MFLIPFLGALGRRAGAAVKDREDKRRAEAKLESEAVRVREVNRAGSGT